MPDYQDMAKRILEAAKKASEPKGLSVGSRWECKNGHTFISEPGLCPGRCLECKSELEYRGGQFLRY